MAIAAYASVISLLSSLDNVLLPCRRWMIPDMSQIEILQHKLTFLQEFLQLHSSNKTTSNDEALRDLAVKLQISEVVHDLDDLIDKYVVDRLRTQGLSDDDDDDDEMGKKRMSSSFYHDLQVLIGKIESINEELTKFKDKGRAPRNSFRAGSTGGDNSSAVAVGLEDDVIKMMDRLTGNEPCLQVVPIVGMGGIGKTTLARNAFDNKLILEHFSVRIWITISQEYDVQKILLGLKKDGFLGDKNNDDDNNDLLGTCLYQKLYGRRYLIVMDDVWGTDAWDEFRPFFPNNENRSRIVTTTRLSNVARYTSADNHYSMSFLDEENSWKLFSEKAFRNGGRSSELEEIGKKIASKCGGLPLTLVVVGGLLANSDMTRGYWESVAADVNSFYHLEIEESCLRILYLSYNHLPIHLKACFLWLNNLHEDYYAIDVPNLIEWWVAEGIVRPTRDNNNNKTLEEVAMEYLEDLIGRNMILIRELGICGDIKACGIHDILRQVCIKESLEENIFGILNMDMVSSIDDSSSCFQCGDETRTRKRIGLCEVLNGSTSTALMTPMVCDHCITTHPWLVKSRYIRLINKVDGRIVEIPHPTKLAWLSIRNERDCFGELEYASPPTISLLWNLRVLREGLGEGEDGEVLISKIWEMPQLRKVRAGGHALPDPTGELVILQHLQTLCGVKNFKCTEEVIGRIPNLVELMAVYESDSEGAEELNYCLNNLALVHKLRSLELSFDDISLGIENIAFPNSLKKLVLTGCGLRWEGDMTMVGSLPNLQVLMLYDDAFVGEEWCMVEGQFQKLKYLRIDLVDLVTWRAEANSLPALEMLLLGGLHSLVEFPLGVGDMDTLVKIYVADCSESIVDSVMQIKEEQENFGNEVLVELRPSYIPPTSDDEFS